MTLDKEIYYISSHNVLELMRTGKTKINNYPFESVNLEIEEEE